MTARVARMACLSRAGPLERMECLATKVESATIPSVNRRLNKPNRDLNRYTQRDPTGWFVNKPVEKHASTFSWQISRVGGWNNAYLMQVIVEVEVGLGGMKWYKRPFNYV